MPQRAASLEEMLDQIEEVSTETTSVTFDQILDAVGRRSFGPLLIVAGLVVLAPVVGDIPGMPTAVAIFVALVAGQFAFGAEQIWLPRWMLDRSVKSARHGKPLRFLRKPAAWIDGLTRPRLRALAGPHAVRVVASICLALAGVMPLMEVVPFRAYAAGLILAVFGLALIASDGLMVVIGTLVTLATLVLMALVLF